MKRIDFLPDKRSGRLERGEMTNLYWRKERRERGECHVQTEISLKLEREKVVRTEWHMIGWNCFCFTKLLAFIFHNNFVVVIVVNRNALDIDDGSLISAFDYVKLKS